MKIELSNEQLQVIDQALQQLTYNIAAPLIAHINQQKNAQARSLLIGGKHPSSPFPVGCAKWEIFTQNH